MKRITYLDGLRGLACMQVVFYHFAWFWPKISFGFVTNGLSAVAVFFLISGFVLTASFERTPNMVIVNTTTRLIRLILPALASVLVAAILMLFVGQDRHAILKAILPDLSMKSLILGYAGTSLFYISGLPQPAISLNPPLWTLNIEIWGSILILLLVWLRCRSRLLHVIFFVGIICLIGSNELSLFLIGHLAALTLRKPTRESRGSLLIGLCLLCCGIFICQMPTIIPGGSDFALYAILFKPLSLSTQTEIGSIFIFFSVVLTRGFQSILEGKILNYFGRLSFSIYLLHWPVMLISGCMMLLLSKFLGHEAATIAAFTFGLIFILSIASLFEHYVDIPVLNLIKSIKSYATRTQRRAVRFGFNTTSD